MFVPPAGAQVLSHRYDLVVDGGGAWQLLSGDMADLGYATTPGGRLARDLTDHPRCRRRAGELLTWVAEESVLDVSLNPRPGDSVRRYAVRIVFTVPEPDRLDAILSDLRRLGLSTQASGRVDPNDTENWLLITALGPAMTTAMLASPLLSRRHYADVALALAVIRRAGGVVPPTGLEMLVSVRDFKPATTWLGGSSG